MKLRAPLAAVLASVAVAATLAGCDSSNVGLAAKVDGTRITESQLSHYVTPAAQGVALQSTAAKTPPKSFVLFILIYDRLYANLLRSTQGGMPSAGVISSEIHSLFGDKTPQQAAAELKVYGYTAELDQAVLRFRALSTLLSNRPQRSVSAALNKLSFPVTINPRYGTWNAKQYTIETTTRAGLPGFVHLQKAGGAGALPGLSG